MVHSFKKRAHDLYLNNTAFLLDYTKVKWASSTKYSVDCLDIADLVSGNSSHTLITSAVHLLIHAIIHPVNHMAAAQCLKPFRYRSRASIIVHIKRMTVSEGYTVKSLQWMLGLLIKQNGPWRLVYMTSTSVVSRKASCKRMAWSNLKCMGFCSRRLRQVSLKHIMF